MLTDDPAAPLILVVEDDDSHAELIRRSFESSPEEYRLHVARVLHDACKDMDKHTPSLLLTDYRLPDGDGGDLVKMVNATCPVVMMTSRGNEQVAVDAMKAGVLDYVVKSGEVFSAMPRIAQRALREWALIQERKRMEEALAAREQEFRAMIENSPDPIIRYDRDGRRIYVNPATEWISGKEAGSLLGNTPREGMLVASTEGDRIAAWIRQVVETGTPTEGEVEYVAPDGAVHYFHSRYVPEWGKDGEVASILSVSRDITELKRMQNELMKAQKLESFGVLAGGIAHDFNNILTCVIGNIAIAKERLDLDSPVMEFLSRAGQTAQRATELVRRLMLFSKGGTSARTPVSVREIVEESVSMALQGTPIQGEIQISDSIHCIEADAGQFLQVCSNIAINAVQAMMDGGTLRVDADNASRDECAQRGLPPGTYVRLAFSDEGKGISEEDQKRIFDPFFTTKTQGCGLGLASTQAIIKKHNGRIFVSSKIGIGTTFTVYLPSMGRRFNRFEGVIAANMG